MRRAGRGLLGLVGILLSAALSAAPYAQRAEFVSLQLPDGHRLQAELRVPEQLDGPVPAVLLFGGLEGTDHILSVIHSQQPAVLASFSYPYEKPRQRGWRAVKPIVDEFGVAVDRTFAGIAELTRTLRARPDVDPARLSIVGASAGAPFATISAERLDLAGLVVVQGFADMPRVFARLLYDFWQGAPDWLRGPVSVLFGHTLVWYLDLPEPAESARALLANQRVLMITATEDQRIPAASTEALWEALQQSRARTRRLDLPGAHLRGIGDEAIPGIMRRATDWMQAEGLL